MEELISLFPSTTICERCRSFDWSICLPFVKRAPEPGTLENLYTIWPGNIARRRPAYRYADETLGSLRQILAGASTCPLCDFFCRLIRYFGFLEGPSLLEENTLDAKFIISTTDGVSWDCGYNKEGIEESVSIPLLNLSIWRDNNYDAQGNWLQSVAFAAKPAFQLINFGNSSSAERTRVGKLLPARCDLARLKSCLRNCSEDHYHNVQTRSNVRQGVLVGFSLRLVDTQENCLISVPWSELDDRYVALSYVWGVSDQETKLTTENIASLHVSGSLPVPCATVRDAMTVFKALGLRYFWCDVLCVIQDDRVDRARCISMMGVIYNCAHLTIVAAAGKNCLEGLYGISHDRSPQTVVVVEDFGLSKTCSQPGGLSVDLESDPDRTIDRPCTWATRAWNFQEYLLSERVVIFFDEQTVWICPEGIWPEELDLDCTKCQPGSFEGIGIGKNLGTYFRNPKALEKIAWMDQSSSNLSLLTICAELIGEYTRRQLTLATDIENAFQGLMHFMPAEFWWGLPTHGFDNFVCWWKGGDEMVRRLGWTSGGPPSWSWMSLMGPIIVQTWAYPTTLRFHRYNATADTLLRVETGEAFDDSVFHSGGWRDRLIPYASRIEPEWHLIFWAEVGQILVGFNGDFWSVVTVDGVNLSFEQTAVHTSVAAKAQHKEKVAVQYDVIVMDGAAGSRQNEMWIMSSKDGIAYREGIMTIRLQDWGQIDRWNTTARLVVLG